MRGAKPKSKAKLEPKLEPVLEETPYKDALMGKKKPKGSGKGKPQ